ncbi:Ger(x)C family spore germination C-terminal domain-containing protein [Bacillus anthracis]|nr:Ger(x)C family spore germination C-terminal domain-containing protein [Bacillus anthracis]
MVGQIDTKVTRGLMWLRNEIQESALTIHPKKGESISLDIVRQATKLFPVIEDGKWKITVKVKSEVTIVQNGSHFDIMNPDVTKKLEKDLERDIKQYMNLALKQLKKR